MGRYAFLACKSSPPVTPVKQSQGQWTVMSKAKTWNFCLVGNLVCSGGIISRELLYLTLGARSLRTRALTPPWGKVVVWSELCWFPKKLADVVYWSWLDFFAVAFCSSLSFSFQAFMHSFPYLVLLIYVWFGINGFLYYTEYRYEAESGNDFVVNCSWVGSHLPQNTDA